MTIKEIVKKNPNITINEEGRILVMPHRKYGLTAYPVDETRAVTITPEEYAGLCSRTMCWEGDRVIACEKSAEEITAAKKKELQATMNEALIWLNKHDYIGVKIASALLAGTQAEIDTLKAEYAATIEAAKEKRTVINQCKAAISQLESSATEDFLMFEKGDNNGSNN